MKIAVNKKARFNFEIIEEIEAGISLKGTEVKSLRDKKVNLVDSYAVFKENELFLINARIEPYTHASVFNHDPVRARKLLLKEKEISKLKGKLLQKGWVMLPLSIYFKNNKWVKIQLGLGKSKKKHDKRQILREKDIARETEREMKRYR